MDSALYKSLPNGFRELTLPPYEYELLNHDAHEQRILILHPYTGNPSDKSNHVKCTMEIQSLSNLESFVAVSNSRGYRFVQEAIEIDGKALIISAALELFLRHFRRTDTPVRLWIRHICLIESDKEEQKRYWTRAFIDSMYERASTVVDMSKFNQKNLDSGLIQTVHDSNYAEWTKEWYGLPKHTPLPRVYPIRIGQHLSELEPKDKFAYVPLDMVSKEIRVLVIKPSEDPMAPVVAHLAHCPIKCEVAVQALSYVWGSADKTVDIVLNGQIMTITQSLERTMQAIRRPTGSIVIWIDAICINQKDVFERNYNLPRIAQVYDYAVAVLSYIGPMNDNADEAMDFLQHLQEPVMRMNSMGNWDIGKDQKIGPEVYPRLCAALYKLLTRPYFRRVWILQEVAYASNLVVGCGDRFDVAIDTIEKAAYNLQDMLRRDDRLANNMKLAVPDLKIVSKSELAYVRKLSYFRYLISKGNDSISRLLISAKIGDNSPGILETAILARDFQATVGHDKIFALWNLAQDKEGLDFKMNYAESLSDSFTKFAIAWAMQHKSLDIIAVAVCDEKSREFYKMAPTWCPDWTIPSRISCLVRRESIPVRPMGFMDDLDNRLYNADGGMTNNDFEQPLFEFDGKTLLCTGVIVDEIEVVLSSPNLKADSEEEDTHFAKFFQYLNGITEFFATSKECPYEDPRRAAWAMFHGDVPSVWLPRQDSQNCDDRYPGEEYVCEYKKSRHILQYAGSYLRADSWDAVRMTLKGRTLGISSKGYLCLVPYYIATEQSQGPWLLAILATCSVPILLQEYEGGFYRAAGACFVQGWMEGEVLIDSLGAVNSRTFWAERQGDKKLRIL